MKIKESMYKFLKNTPQARYRKYIPKVICRIVQKEHARLAMIPEDLLQDYISEIVGLDRNFRLVMGENEWWSEEDKKNKRMLEEKKMLELGYEVGIKSDLEWFNNLK